MIHNFREGKLVLAISGQKRLTKENFLEGDTCMLFVFSSTKARSDMRFLGVQISLIFF